MLSTLCMLLFHEDSDQERAVVLRGVFGPSRAQLIRQMGSADNKAALQAVEKLKDNGWFRDGSLQGADLRRANLRGAALARANLEGANRRGADLSHAYLGATILRAADLREAIIQGANLRQVILHAANLAGADLTGSYLAVSDLREADLTRACLQSANLWQARLGGANLAQADLRFATLYATEFDPDTILPDGARWTPAMDMARFTDPTHPTFWHLPSMNGSRPA